MLEQDFMDFLEPTDDLSNEKGFQWQFCCPRCGGGHLSTFEYYDPGTVGLLAKTLTDTGILKQFGGALGKLAGEQVYESGRDDHRNAAYRRAVLDARLDFEKCGACSRWSCRDPSCWDAERKRCVPCTARGATAGPGMPGAELPNDPFLMQEAIQYRPAPPPALARQTRCQWCGADEQAGETCNHCGAQL